MAVGQIRDQVQSQARALQTNQTNNLRLGQVRDQANNLVQNRALDLQVDQVHNQVLDLQVDLVQNLALDLLADLVHNLVLDLLADLAHNLVLDLQIDNHTILQEGVQDNLETDHILNLEAPEAVACLVAECLAVEQEEVEEEPVVVEDKMTKLSYFTVCNLQSNPKHYFVGVFCYENFVSLSL
jgi:hypothetical protein